MLNDSAAGSSQLDVLLLVVVVEQRSDVNCVIRVKWLEQFRMWVKVLCGCLRRLAESVGRSEEEGSGVEESGEE